MFPSLTKCLLYAELLFLAGCASAYKDLRPVEGTASCLNKFIPSFTTNWYTAKIDVEGRHISGLLLVKAMADSSTRIVFTNEAGIKFLDVGFNRNEFEVFSIMNALDKKAVVNTLEKDFELMLVQPAMKGQLIVSEKGNERYYGFQGQEETVYLVTSRDCTTLLRVERASKRKKKTEALFVSPDRFGVPDSIHISHATFNMEIGLKKMNK